MGFRVSFVVLAMPLAMLHAQAPVIATFQGLGVTSIQAMTSDTSGNIYVAGTTAASDLPVKNAIQPQIGEAPLMRSTDGGRTWQKLSNVPTGTVEVAPHPTNPQILLIAGEFGIEKSTNGGQTWRRVYSWASPPRDIRGNALNVAFDPANPRQAYAYLPSDSPGIFLASGDGGDTWEARITPPFADTFGFGGARVLWVDPNGSGTVLLGRTLSRDRGASWQPLRLSLNNTFQMALTPDPHRAGGLYLVTDQALDYSTDWGASWTRRQLPAGQSVSEFTIDPDIANTLYVTARSSLYRSSDGGLTWTGIAQAPPAILSGFGRIGMISARCFGGTMLFATGGAVDASFDFGQTWGAPQLDLVQRVISAPACTAYAIRATTSDAFLAKLSPKGELLWSTFFGGSNFDLGVAISLGPDDSVYLAGNTASTDFPSTVPRTGPPGRMNVFLARFESDGALRFSTVFGGEFSDFVTSLAVDSGGNAYLAGSTNSTSFPAPPAGAGNGGFAAKVSSEGQYLYGAYLPFRSSQSSYQAFTLRLPNAPLPITVARDGSAVIGGNLETLSRLSADGTAQEVVAKLPGPVQLLATGSDGYIYAAGQITTAPVTSVDCFYGYVNHQTTYMPAADTYVTKLKAGTFEPVFTRRLAGTCRTQPTDMKISANGEITLGVWTFGQLALRDPVQASGRDRTAIARISADGSEVQFSSYLTGATAVAIGESGALFASAYRAFNAAEVRVLPLLASPKLAIESISQSVSGFRESVRGGSLATITGRGFADEPIDLGLDYAGPLPRALGGVQVLFDGVAAELLQVAPDHVVFVAPGPLAPDGWASVQVVTATEKSTPFLVNGEYRTRPTLLTRAFPFSPAGNVDGSIRNADGTENSQANPAVRGSTVTLYATGVEDPGNIDLYWAVKPFVPDPRPAPGPTGPGPIRVTAAPMPGFLSLLYQIKFKVPAELGPGVDYLPPPGVATRIDIGTENVVGIWVK